MRGVSLSAGAGMSQICHTLEEWILWTGDSFKTLQTAAFLCVYFFVVVDFISWICVLMS